MQQQGSETILVAEDNDGLRELVHEVLQRRGYRILLARNGEEAVELFARNQTDVALLLLDVVMPKMDGITAYMKIEKIKPGVPVVFTTGHTAESLLLNPSIRRRAVFLEKPYRLEAVGNVVREQIDLANQKHNSL